MGNNKIIYAGNVLIDLTQDTVVSEKLASGYTAHGADGEIIEGSLTTIPVDPYYFDLNIGYVDNGTWKPEVPTRTYCDVYKVLSGHTYLICLSQIVGSRFRAMFVTTDIIENNVQTVGTRIVNTNSPAPYSTASYVCSEDGYIIVAKDNVGVTDIRTIFFDMTAW